jgi:hypothetical protein
VNAHVLIFECPNCGRPIPLIHLDERISYPDNETANDQAPILCLGNDCHWSGHCLAAAAKQRWDVGWPHLKHSGSYSDRSVSAQ